MASSKGDSPAPGAPRAKATLRFGAVVLAAGPSSRMGSPKQLLEIDGRSLIARTVETMLATDAWPIVVVLGANAERIRPQLARQPVLIAENPAWAEGMAASIRCGLETLREFSRSLDAAVLTLCDQPALSAESIRRLVAAQSESGRGIVAARYLDRNGAPALFLREHFAALGALTGEEGARALLQGGPERVATVDLPELAFDLDTPSDLATWQKRA